MASVLALSGEVAIWSGATNEGPRAVTAWTALLLTVPLAWRRTAVVWAVIVYLCGGLLQAALADPPSSIWALAVLLLMSFSLGSGVSGRRLAWLGACLVAGVWVTVLGQPDAHIGDKLFTAPMLAGGPLLVGVALRRQQSRAEGMARLAVQLERDREDGARAAVAAERARIARELHDVVAHAVSVMVVQAGAAEELMATDPANSRKALAAVRVAGKESLAELRRMLGVIRSDDVDRHELAPQPGLSDLAALLDTAREAGLDVEVHRCGTPTPLPPGLDLTAYRVLQESLTNVRKHVGPRTHVVVALEFTAQGSTAQWFTIRVTDDGPGRGVVPENRFSAGGYGIAGMRERVGLYGGHIAAGLLPAGGWQVEARLPVPANESLAIR